MSEEGRHTLPPSSGPLRGLDGPDGESDEHVPILGSQGSRPQLRRVPWVLTMSARLRSKVGKLFRAGMRTVPLDKSR